MPFETDLRVTTHRDLLHTGMTKRAVERDRRARDLEPIHRGIYAVRARDTGTEDPEVRWRTRMLAHLVRGGPGSALSHRAAAIIHRFDGWTDPVTELSPEDLLVPLRSPFRSPPAIRTRLLLRSDVVERRGLLVTTKGRTLADLGRFLTHDDVEIAVESALRIDPRRPDVWDEDLLADLERRVAAAPGGRSGLATLRAVLARRPLGTRPTGSDAETRAIQALRPVGLGDLARQPTIRLLDDRGAVLREAFPDIAGLDRGVFLEIDGAAAHASAIALDRDLLRQNALLEVFCIRRFAATRVLRDPVAFARSVHAVWEREPPRFAGPGPWMVRDFRIVRTADGLDVHVPASVVFSRSRQRT